MKTELQNEMKIFFLGAFLCSLVLIYTIANTSLEFSGWPIKIMTLVYLLLINYLGIIKKIQVNPESYFWQANLVILCISTLSNEHNQLSDFVFLAYFFILLYLPACHFKTLMFEKTSEFFLFDIYHHFLLIFRTKENHKVLLSFFKRVTNPKVFEKKEVRAIFIGLLISIFMLVTILPMLSIADASNQIDAFIQNQILVLFSDKIFWQSIAHILKIITSFFIALVVTAVFMKLFYASDITEMNLQIKNKDFSKVKRLSPITTSIIFMMLLFLYIAFIILQYPYFFSAFLGKLPGDLIYSSYARRGFFELCTITVINVTLIMSNALFMEKLDSPKWNLFFKVSYVMIAVITILLIIIAFSKMFLYMQVYQLTTKRVVVCVFLLYFALIWGCFIIKQFMQIKITRIAILTGAIFVITLCSIHVNIWVEKYNLNKALEWENEISMQKEHD